MDVSKRRRKRKRSQEHTADKFIEVNVPLLAAEEAVDNSQPKGSDRGHVNAEEYHGEVLFDQPNPSDVAEQSDELESSGFREASLSPVTNNSTENKTQLLDEWLKNNNRDTNLPLDSRDPDFDKLWSYVRDDLLDRCEDNFEDELNSVMDVEDEDVWFNAEEHLQLSDNGGEFSSLPSQCAGNPQEPEENRDTPGPKEKTDLDQEPLYKGANVTLGSVMVLLVMFVIRHNLTSEALENLLSIIAALLPASSILPSSVSRFKKYFTNLKHPFVFHHYCSFCFAYISE